jgi:hypothetical protein
MKQQIHVFGFDFLLILPRWLLRTPNLVMDIFWPIVEASPFLLAMFIV